MVGTAALREIRCFLFGLTHTAIVVTILFFGGAPFASHDPAARPLGDGTAALRPIRPEPADLAPMYRGLLTATVSAFLILVCGGSALVIGLIYPFRPVIALAIRIWAWGVLRTAGVRLTVEGAHHIADGQPRVFMGNHQSGLDIPIIMRALRGRVRFMAKKSLFYFPVFGWVLLRYGFVPIDRSKPRVALARLNRMVERIRRHPISFVVFPEGTRSRDGRLLPFRRGTMKIGKRMGLPIVPFSIDGAINVHHRDHIRTVPGPVRLTFLEPIPAEEVATLSPGELLNRVLSAVQRGLAHDATVAASPDRKAAGRPSLTAAEGA